MKAYGGVDMQTHVSLTSALPAGEWSVSCPGRFTPGERAPGTHWIADRVDDVEKKKFLTYRDSNSEPSVVQIVASRYTNYAIPALI
jgi:hypothetical protein